MIKKFNEFINESVNLSTLKTFIIDGVKQAAHWACDVMYDYIPVKERANVEKVFTDAILKSFNVCLDQVCNDMLKNTMLAPNMYINALNTNILALIADRMSGVKFVIAKKFINKDDIRKNIKIVSKDLIYAMSVNFDFMSNASMEVVSLDKAWSPVLDKYQKDFNVVLVRYIPTVVANAVNSINSLL